MGFFLYNFTFIHLYVLILEQGNMKISENYKNVEMIMQL